MANRFQKYVQPQALPFQGNGYADDLGVSDVSEADIYKAMGTDPPARQNRFAKYAQQEQFGPQNVEPQPDDFFSRVGNNIMDRRQNIGEIQQARKSGEQGYIESGFQEAGQAAGLINDIVGQGFQSLGKGVSYITPDFIEKPVRQAGSYVLDTASNLPSFSGRTIGEDIPQELRMLEENHPRAMRNIGAAANIGSVLYAAKPVNGKDIVDAAGSGATKLNTKSVLPSIQDVKNKSQALFKSGLNKGASFSDDAADELLKTVEAERVTDAFAKGALGPDEMDAVAKRLAEARKSPMTLDSYEALDKEWGSLAHQAAVAGKDNLARQYEILQAKLRDVAQDPNFIKGSAEGIQDYQKAVKLWAVRSKMRDIEQINEYAKYYVGGEAAGIKAGYARLAKSNKIYKYSPKEAKMIQKAAQTGLIEGPLRNLGSGLMMIGGFVKGGPAGAAAAYGLSKAARGAAGALKGVESSKIGKSIAKQAVKISPDLVKKQQRIPVDKLKQIMKMPPKEAKAALQAAKQEQLLLMGPNSARPMTDAQIKAARADNAKTSSGFKDNGLGDVPYNYIAPEAPAKPKLLAAPDKMSSVPMTEQEIALARAQNTRGRANPVDPSGGSLKTPVSQFGKLEATLGKKRYGEFKDTVQIFKDGDMSQNQFVKDVQKFGLTTTQARSLAKEIQTYQKN